MNNPSAIESPWNFSDSSDSEAADVKRDAAEGTSNRGTCKRTITAEFQLSSEERPSLVLPFAPMRTGSASSLNAHIMIRMMDNHVIHCNVSENDTLEGLIDALRRRGKVFRVDDVTLRGFSLMSWKKHSMEAIGVQGGDEIHVIEEKPSRQVTVRIEATDQEMVVQVASGKNCWNQMKKMLLVPTKKHYDVMIQESMYYRRNHEWHRAVADYSKDGQIYFDENSGDAIYGAKRLLVVVEFLTAQQGVRAAPQGNPRLVLYDAILGWENDHVVFLNSTAPFNHAYIACLWGFHCREGNDSILFLQILNNNYVECILGSKELSREKVLEYHRNKKLTPQAICLLLRENSRIPQWHNRCMKPFALFRRDGVELKITKGRLFCATPTSFVDGTSSWILRYAGTPFEDDFNREVIRKKQNTNNQINAQFLGN